MTLRSVFLSSSLLLVAACGGSHESADTELCEHLQDGPSVAVTATATATGAPSVSEAHKRYDITLVDVTGGKGGVVTFASGHELDHTIALSEDVPLKITDSAGAEVAPESSTSSGDCAEIKRRHVVPLKVGTYTLTFGATTKTSVQAVIEAAPHEH